MHTGKNATLSVSGFEHINGAVRALHKPHVLDVCIDKCTDTYLVCVGARMRGVEGHTSRYNHGCNGSQGSNRLTPLKYHV